MQNNADRSFFTFYNKLHKTLNKRAPIITISRHSAKQISKPWVTQGIRKSLKVKNNLYYLGDKYVHKIYRNKISTLSRQSKQLYYHAYFNENLKNMKNTWAGINLLINWTNKKNLRPFRQFYPPTVMNILTIPPKFLMFSTSIFFSVIRKLASKIPPTNCHFTEYLSVYYNESFFFNPVAALVIENGIVSILLNKAHGLYCCPTRILRSAEHILSKPLAETMNMLVTMDNTRKR